MISWGKYVLDINMSTAKLGVENFNTEKSDIVQGTFFAHLHCRDAAEEFTKKEQRIAQVYIKNALPSPIQLRKINLTEQGSIRVQVWIECEAIATRKILASLTNVLFELIYKLRCGLEGPSTNVCWYNVTKGCAFFKHEEDAMFA